MSHQLPPLSDPDQFERLVCDILRRVYDDPGIERFGRKGQSQSGIDGFSPLNSKITFQCKLKDTRYKSDESLREILLSEMEKEFQKTEALSERPERFIFATTFKNDRALQEKATALSSNSTTVEYWGWDTINEQIWRYPDALIPIYYPHLPVRPVAGFRQITSDLIARSHIDDKDVLNKLALEYYRINDRSDLVFKVVCNDIDVRNPQVMHVALNALQALPPSGTLWLVGDGGSGKTTILHRIALELAQSRAVFSLDLEAHLTRHDLQSILWLLKYGATSAPIVLCVDNPAADEEILETLLREVPEYSSSIHIVLAERSHRYRALRRTGTQTYLHGEEELEPLFVRNPRNHRERVYDKLFTLLEVSDEDQVPLREIVRNENLVYVNATYSILIELKKKRKIDFDFDWDDYRNAAPPGFQEGYKYIALFYLFGVRTPFTTFSRIHGANAADQNQFLDQFRGLVNEPIVVDERRDEFGRKNVYVRTKHEIISEIFFREHPEIDKNELLMSWVEHTDFEDTVEAQVLINIFGAKKNYWVEDSHVDFGKLIDFLLHGQLSEKLTSSPKLNATLHLAKFWLLSAEDPTDEAIEVLKSYLEIEPENLHCRTELAKAYQRRNQFSQAEEILNELLVLEPNNPLANTELARIYQRQGKLAEAEATLKAVIDNEPRDLSSRTELAKVYQRQNKLLEAEKVLLEVLALRQNDLNSRTELAKVYQKQNKLAEAEEVLLKLLKLDRKNIRAFTELARVYQREGRLAEAETRLLESLEIDDKQLHPRTELAKIYQRQGKLAEAESVLVELLKLDNSNLQARTELAKIYQRQGKLAEAESVLVELLKLDNSNLQARTELAKIYQRQGKLAEAEAVLMKLLELEPDDLQARTELAKIYQRQGKLAEAEAVLIELLKLDVRNLQARTELAKIYQRQGKLAEAEARLLESLEIDDKQLHPRTELAKIYQRQGKLAEAEARLLESLEIDDKQLHPRTELAKIYQRQGKFDEAAKRAEEVLSLDPLNDHAMSELLGIWQRVGDKENCELRFIEFISQPGYQFTRFSQAPVFRFFQCCRKFGLNELAYSVFERFEPSLDDRNIELFRGAFRQNR